MQITQVLTLMMDTLFDRLNIRTGRALMLTEDAHKQEERETEAKKKKFKEAQKLLVQLKKF